MLSFLHILLPIFRSIQKVLTQLKRLSFRGERALRVRRATKIWFLPTEIQGVSRKRRDLNYLSFLSGLIVFADSWLVRLYKKTSFVWYIIFWFRGDSYTLFFISIMWTHFTLHSLTAFSIFMLCSQTDKRPTQKDYLIYTKNKTEVIHFLIH